MKKMNYWLKRQGFTLIELLLVIAVVSVLATFGLTTYRERALNLKAEKVAQQMQLIMQAASNYYIRNSCWPNNYPPIPTTTIPSCKDKPYPASEPFLSFQANEGYFSWPGAMRQPGLNGKVNLRLYNPFSSTLTVGPDIPSTAYWYRRAGPATDPEGAFQLDSGVLPNADFARRVAALLPNAQVTSDTGLNIPVQVSTTIFPPGTQSQGDFILKSVGYVTEGEEFWFTCPFGYKGQLTLSIQDYSVKMATTGPAGIPNVLRHIDIGPGCVETPPGSNTYMCKPNSSRKGGAGGDSQIGEGLVHYYYIMGCCKRNGCGVIPQCTRANPC